MISVLLAPCHDGFRGPPSDYVRQVALETTTTAQKVLRSMHSHIPYLYKESVFSRYRSLSWHYFQDGDRFNSCQVIYSQFGLAIHQNDHQARRRFVEWAQTRLPLFPIFISEFCLAMKRTSGWNGYVNKQNSSIWSEANPQMYVKTPLHPEKLTVWCALWAGGILLQKTMKATTLQSMVIGIEP
ncbi:hypothetical protein TNCV_2268381 [Trichonephila clavipes]|nr:hypothetical protein TNCV_2268381 [Trichonephila clavipes]